MELNNMYNNVEKFVLAGVILCIGSLFLMMDQSEEVKLSENTYTESFKEATVDVEITSLVNSENMGISVNDEAITSEKVETISKEAKTIPILSFNDAFLAARKELGANQTFAWNGNVYSTNYADEVFEISHTEVAVEEILIDETEPQLSQVENDESLAYTMQE